MPRTPKPRVWSPGALQGVLQRDVVDMLVLTLLSRRAMYGHEIIQYLAALTDEAVEILDEAGIKQAVMDMAVERICGNLERRTEKMKIECMMFSNKFGELGKSREAEKWFIS